MTATIFSSDHCSTLYGSDISILEIRQVFPSEPTLAILTTIHSSRSLKHFIEWALYLYPTPSPVRVPSIVTSFPMSKNHFGAKTTEQSVSPASTADDSARQASAII